MSDIKTIIETQQQQSNDCSSIYNTIHEQVLSTYGNNALAIVVYGSCLSQTTQKKDSVPDYFIIVDDFKTYYDSFWQRNLNKVLPPNIYHFEIPQGFSKYSVVSLKQLDTQTQFNKKTQAKDLYFLGRFSKNIHLHWFKDESIKKAMVQVQTQACFGVARLVLSSLNLGDRLDLRKFAIRCIGLSYVGDVRVEAKDKVEKLFQSQEQYYLNLYEQVLKKLHQEKTVYFDPDNKTVSAIDANAFTKNYKRYIFKSKLRSQLRWPKAMFTAKKWLDYVLLKIKRNYGEEYTLNDQQKKYWFIYAWPLLFKLYQKKLLK